MSVTADQMAALRAYLKADFDEHDRIHAGLDPVAARTGYNALVSAAFVEAVERRFAKNGTTEQVIDFVGAVRARSDRLNEEIDPRIAERLILAVYTDEQIDDIDPSTQLGTQFVLLAALVVDEQFNADELEEFLGKARALADEWIG